jgi:hypothetical protein
MADIISICCGCGSVRSAPGSWDRGADYRRTLPTNRLSHGICPPCLERLYPDMFEILAEKARLRAPPPSLRSGPQSVSRPVPLIRPLPRS